jgi:hypothetical protein
MTLKKKYLIKLKGGEPFIIIGTGAVVDDHGYLKVFDDEMGMVYACDSASWRYIRCIGYANNG